MQDIIDVPLEKIKEQVLQRPVSQLGLQQLATSIKAVGILSPLLVVQREEVFHLIAGQRRLLAAGMLHLPTVPCIVVPADQEQALSMTLHENLFREDLTAVDEANLFCYLRDNLHYNGEKIAKLISKSASYVSQRLALLTWDPRIIAALKDRVMSFSVARDLSQVTDVKHRRYLIHHAIDQGINARTATAWVRQWRASMIPSPPPREDDELPPSGELHTRVESDCFYCQLTVDIAKMVNVLLCDTCFSGLREAKEADLKKRKQGKVGQTPT